MGWTKMSNSACSLFKSVWTNITNSAPNYPFTAHPNPPSNAQSQSQTETESKQNEQKEDNQQETDIADQMMDTQALSQRIQAIIQNDNDNDVDDEDEDDDILQIAVTVGGKKKKTNRKRKRLKPRMKKMKDIFKTLQID